jgi:SH3 domain protein
MSPQPNASSLLATVLAAILAASTSPPLRAEYVSDELIVDFRALPSSNGRILKMLDSGTWLEVLETSEDNEWSRVRIRDGTEGWVRKQYLVSEPIARVRLESASRQVEQLTRTVSDLQKRLEAVQSERSEAEQSTSSLTGEVGELELELAEIKRVSVSAIETEAENQRLNELNARLRAELGELVEERDRLAANVQQRWMMIGGGLVLTGLLFGLIVKSRPRRSAWT